jgi:hypothetical protein
VTDSIDDQGVNEQRSSGEQQPAEGPDPAIGAGITLLGIFIMGTGGAADAHYVFDAGMVVGVLGAATFVLFVALSAMKMRQQAEQHSEQS